VNLVTFTTYMFGSRLQNQCVSVFWLKNLTHRYVMQKIKLSPFAAISQRHTAMMWSPVPMQFIHLAIPAPHCRCPPTSWWPWVWFITSLTILEPFAEKEKYQTGQQKITINCLLISLWNPYTGLW